MMNGIKSGTELSDRTPERRSSNREAEGAEPSILNEESEAEPAPGSDLRLLIEKDARGDYYVYKLVDRATGEVIAERPRDQVAHLADGPGYRAGAVVNTKA
jgi:hypothetical protein